MIMEIPEELLRVTVRIMRFRDALNDFGFSENEREGDVLTWRELQEQLRNFQKTLQKIMEEQGVIFEGV